MAVAIELCPRCHRGTRVEAFYELDGMIYDDSYCGACGKNWPKKQEPFKP